MCVPRRLHALLLVPLIYAGQASAQAPRAAVAPPTLEDVIPNDNRAAAGSWRQGRLEVDLEARHGMWRPDLGVDSAVTVQAFAVAGGTPSIPAPLLRAAEGSEVVVRVRNTLPMPLVVSGLRAGSVARDTLHVQPGELREVRFRATLPGTYLYWGSTTGDTVASRSRR